MNAFGLILIAMLAGACMLVMLNVIAKLCVQTLGLVIMLCLTVVNLALTIFAWLAFGLWHWWQIPQDPESRSLATDGFFESHLVFGRTLYEHNLSWRRDLSKHRAAVRNGDVPVPRFRFTWAAYFRALVN